MGDQRDGGIAWTDVTWNPVTGCRKLSEGCRHCYAERVFPRAYSHQFVRAGDGNRIEDHDPATTSIRPRRFTDVWTHPDRLEQPLHWCRPRRVFVNSMSDLFHEDVPFDFIDRVFAVMALAQQHVFQVLTKRPERMREYLCAPATKRLGIIFNEAIGMGKLSGALVYGRFENPWLPNVWLGVSVENQDTLERIDILKDVPAAIRFVSFEPLLEDLGALILDGIQWVIIGGESGPKARPMNLDWPRSILKECRRQGVAPFVKQLGTNPYEDAPLQDVTLIRLSDSHGANIDEFPRDLRVREFPK